jgi:RimJ/RimL family protein N-acetyltransferase
MSFKYIFETLKLHRLALLTDHDNIKMRSFFEKFGFVFEGYKRENVVWNGVYKDGAEYSVLDREWPAVKEKMEAKMAQKN